MMKVRNNSNAGGTEYKESALESGMKALENRQNTWIGVYGLLTFVYGITLLFVTYFPVSFLLQWVFLCPLGLTVLRLCPLFFFWKDSRESPYRGCCAIIRQIEGCLEGSGWCAISKPVFSLPYSP